MDAVRPTEERDVHVVVDDEQPVTQQAAKLSRQLQQQTSRQRLVPELHDVGSAADGGGRHFDDALRLGVRGDDVKPGFLKPQLRIWRSFSRNAFGAVSQSHECLTRRFKCASNS